MKKQEAEPTVVRSEENATPSSSSRSVPVHNWRAHWLTANEFARVMGRSPWTIHTWVRNGTLAEFGIPVYRFRQGGVHSGRIFILNIF
jgi:hypothetical protein